MEYTLSRIAGGRYRENPRSVIFLETGLLFASGSTGIPLCKSCQGALSDSILKRFLFNGAGALLAFVLVLAVSSSEAYGQEVPHEALREAFAAGDAQGVLATATERVEVSLLGSSSQYSRSQAIYVLQKFFKDHPPRRFVWRESSTEEQNRFLMGRYWHETSKQPLPVILRLSRAEEGWQLQEVRIGRQ